MVRQTARGKATQLPKVSRKGDSLPVNYLKEKDIFTLDGVLTADEAQRLIEAAESRGFEHQGSRGPAFGEAVRDNGRISLDDKEYADHLWAATGIQAVFRNIVLDGRHACGLNPNIRIYRYTSGQKFGQHYDDSVSLDEERDTQYTLLIYLSGTGSQALVGGETVFYGKRGKVVANVVPKTGMALLHRHGDDCLLHEGKPVKSGIKYLLRSDVVFASR
ncbi:hypothetical protein COCOBI_01-3040 [Coccomyxa sp. Obi]|nr:hypothetical protein COCOBI_01-3040 [Coccomyxa sp. Obi]